MQPTKSRSDSFEPKWTHFHPQAIVWVQNPFDHDVIYQVADEHNVPYQYRLPAHKVCELPGGAVATLGVKAIVDELIQNNKDEVLRIWDKEVRLPHENEIIIRIKEAPKKTTTTIGGEIDLSVSDDTTEALDDLLSPSTSEPEKVETAFPDIFDEDPEAKAIKDASVAGLPESDLIEE